MKGGIMKKRTPRSSFYIGYKLKLCWCGAPEMMWMVYTFYDEWRTMCKTLQEAKDWVDETLSVTTQNYKRPPTKGEIAFGYGATHYLDIPENICLKRDGTIKKWLINPMDGLRYTRHYRHTL